jgi:hypothetical protein
MTRLLKTSATIVYCRRQCGDLVLRMLLAIRETCGWFGMPHRMVVIGGSQFSYELFGPKLCFRFGRVVHWRHDATNLIASDHSRACLQGNSGAPVTRLSLVGNYRIV